MPNLNLVSPLRGWCASLDEAPDAVFAQRLLGDGVAIDPTGDMLYAPCDGSVSSFAQTQHAVVLRAVNGAEILLHVGIDTVGLGGAGFSPLVEAGARVRAGDPLLRFDLDTLAHRATSLLTPIVVTNGDRFTVVEARCGRAVEVGDRLLTLAPAAASVTGTATADGQEVSERLVVGLEHGIHARPAGMIAGFAKAITTEITIAAHGRRASARSPTALMSLGARHGDELILSACGAEAAAAVGELKRRILTLPQWKPSSSKPSSSEPFSWERSPDRESSGPETFAIRRSLPQEPPRALAGVIASRGFAVGRAVVREKADLPIDEAGRGMADEIAALDHARSDVAARLQRLAESTGSTAGEVMAAHLALLDDPELIGAARRAIAEGTSAAFAWRHAVRSSADALQALGDPRMAERIADLLDLESQVLRALRADSPEAAAELPDRAILIAHDLTPSELLSLDADRLAGICTAAGGATSHVAILAAAMGVPALAALGPAVLDIADGACLVLDAEQGQLRIDPDSSTLTDAENKLALRRQHDEAERVAACGDCCTVDGTRISVLANLGSLAEAQIAVSRGAEGCGLLRSEFLFQDRDQPPDEDEQVLHYQQIAGALGGRPLVVRTLDIGGDKPVPFLPMPAEANPALGLRGVRASLSRPDLLRVQLRAILRVAPPDRCRVLLPMVTDASEVRTVRSVLDEERHDLGRCEPMPVGVMIETPASALAAAHIAEAADFLSIGTNDLTQYTLAMDRDHAGLAQRVDGLHPAVLRLIAMTVDGARQHGRPVCICGGLASDPDAVPLLVGLGVVELSVVPALVPQIKRLVRTLDVETCRALAERALSLDTGAEVRELTASRSQPVAATCNTDAQPGVMS